VTDFASEMGNEYIRERPLQEIVDKLMTPQEEEEEEKQEVHKQAEPDHPVTTPVVDPKVSALSNKNPGPAVNKSKDGKIQDS